ncbi:hypothetical protein vBYenSP400_31 [Yersinia phage vB_YenS_P400]|nr:hypothetical protein vBYenSP400_31 [Yersinia phage vB_YenS_P400]
MLSKVCELEPIGVDTDSIADLNNIRCATERKRIIYDWQDWYRDNFGK